MDSFIILGENGEIAENIAKKIAENGSKIHLISQSFPSDFLGNEDFVPEVCDLTNAKKIIEKIEKIVEEENVAGLVVVVPALSESAFEAISLEEISLTISAFVEIPLIAARLVLPSLVKNRGALIAISAGTPSLRNFVLNAICEASTKIIAGTLFNELRDTGVKTCHILLQNNSGIPDKAAAFSKTPQSKIQPALVADAVETVLKFRENNALTQLVLRPAANRETPKIPISAEPRIRNLQKIQLPPAENFPRQEAIPTQKYKRPEYAPPIEEKIREVLREELQKDEDARENFVDPELRYLLKHQLAEKNFSQSAGTQNSQNQNQSAGTPQFDEAGNPLRKKRRRHRSRNRNKNRNGAIFIQPPKINENAEQKSDVPEVKIPEKTRTKKTKKVAPEAASTKEKAAAPEHEKSAPEVKKARRGRPKKIVPEKEKNAAPGE